MNVVAYRFFSGQMAILRIKNKYIFFSKKVNDVEVRWPRPFVKGALVDQKEHCIIVSRASENFIFWLILILSALLLN